MKSINYNKKIKQQEDPTISIITPFYNGGKTLKETFNSLQNQTYPFFEWIIVDDGSKDEVSLKELERISKLDTRIKVFHQKNGGPSIARDYAVSKSDKNIKYLFFLDCDDLLDKTTLEVFYFALENNPDASFAYSSIQNFGEKEFIWNKYFDSEIEKVENLICIASMIRKKDFLEVGGFELKEKGMYEDWNLWLKLLSKGKKPIIISNPLFLYRASSSGELSRAKQNHKRAMKYINETGKNVGKVEGIQFPKCNQSCFYYSNFKNNMTLPYYEKDDKESIIFLIPWAIVGGADIFNIELIKRISNKYNIIVATTLPMENTLREEFRKYSTYYELASFLEIKDYYNFIKYLIESRNIEYVFISNTNIGYSLLPLIKNDFKNIKVIDYVHSIDFKASNFSFGTYTRDFDNYIDKTLTCNNFTKNQLETTFNKSVSTLYIGTDEKKFNKTNFNKEELLVKYNLSKNNKIISFIGRLSEEKRPLLFIEIANRIVKEKENFYFIIAGNGPLLNACKKLIKKYKIKNYVKLLGEIKNPEEIYAISDITVNTSRLEGLALTSYESLSMSVPVISANVGGQSELIDEKVGILIEPLNKEEIENYIKAIYKVLNNLGYYQKNCRDKIITNYTYDKMTANFIDKLKNIKSKNLEFNLSNANQIFKLSVENYYNIFDWLCKEYYLKEYGIDLNSRKYSRIIKKLNLFSIKYNLYEEISVIIKVLKAAIMFAKNFILLFYNMFKTIIYVLELIYVMLKWTLRKIKMGLKI